jgi:hypothetical protein
MTSHDILAEMAAAISGSQRLYLSPYYLLEVFLAMTLALQTTQFEDAG